MEAVSAKWQGPLSVILKLGDFVPNSVSFCAVKDTLLQNKSSCISLSNYLLIITECYIFAIINIATIMNTSVSNAKVQTAFRFNPDLIEKLKARAKRENRSLNNYVEKVLMDIVYDEPNEETIAAMNEAKSSKNMETLDLARFKEFVASL